MGRFVLVALWLALAAPAHAQLRTLQVNAFREDPALAVGRLKGFFARENLEVKVSLTPNSTEQMKRLSNGTYQIASTAFDNVLFWSGREGAELIAVSQVIDSAVYPVFVSARWGASMLPRIDSKLKYGNKRMPSQMDLELKYSERNER